MIKDIHDVKECPECASTNIVYNDSKNQVICQDCGLIYEPLTPKEEEKLERISGIIKKTIEKIKGKKRKEKKRKEVKVQKRKIKKKATKKKKSRKKK